MGKPIKEQLDALWREETKKDFPEKDKVRPYKDQLQKLVEALEAGGYDAAPGKLEQGRSLQVESLEATMRCVTFEDPGAYRIYAKRYFRLMKICRFLRLHSWLICLT